MAVDGNLVVARQLHEGGELVLQLLDLSLLRFKEALDAIGAGAGGFGLCCTFGFENLLLAASSFEAVLLHSALPVSLEGREKNEDK